MVNSTMTCKVRLNKRNINKPGIFTKAQGSSFDGSRELPLLNIKTVKKFNFPMKDTPGKNY